MYKIGYIRHIFFNFQNKDTMTLKKTLTSALLALWAITANAQQGAWKGELNVMGNKLPLVFNFTKDGCTIDSPLQGAKDIPAEKTVKEDGTIKVTIGMIGASFEGKMADDEIKGTFIQNGFPLPLTLKPGKTMVKSSIPLQRRKRKFYKCWIHFQWNTDSARELFKEHACGAYDNRQRTTKPR